MQVSEDRINNLRRVFAKRANSPAGKGMVDYSIPAPTDDSPENIETFDDELENHARKVAEDQGDLSYIRRAVLERAKKKMELFDPKKLITSDQVRNHMFDKRNYRD